ncbi:MAG TPA: Uma2 family endonuclease [Kofleriaceae bacterium]|nr:Uma2 family endonuclease [Kofleriaceae bacterium]
MVAPSRRYTLEDYLSVEEMSAVRHEFLDGAIFAMAGGTPEHAALSAAIVVVLGTRLAGRPCRPYSADLRIRVLPTGLATYADAAVICGDPVRDPASPTHVTNPSLLVEVLGPGTEAYDRGEKREHYQRIASLGEYVLVAQDRREIEVHARVAGGGWRRTAYGPGEVVDLPSIGVRFTVDELYQAAGIR